MNKPFDSTNPPQNNSKQLEKLLAITAERMGTTPELLQEAAKRGDIGEALFGANENESAAFQKLFSDPNLAQNLLSTKEAEELFDIFGEESNFSKYTGKKP